MLKAVIYLDDVVFSGMNYGATTWGAEPKLIESRRNISNYLERIIDRIDDGRLQPGTLRIEIEDDRQ